MSLDRLPISTNTRVHQSPSTIPRYIYSWIDWMLGVLMSPYAMRNGYRYQNGI